MANIPYDVGIVGTGPAGMFAAMEIVEECREFRFGDHLFPSTHGDKPLTQAAIAKILDKLGEAGRPTGSAPASAHGSWTPMPPPGMSRRPHCRTQSGTR